MEFFKRHVHRLGLVATVAIIAFAGGMLGSAYQVDAAQTTSVVGKRIVVAGGSTGPNGVLLLTVPGLGELRGYCGAGHEHSQISWKNTTSGPIDAWMDYFIEGPTGEIVPAGSIVPVALFRSDLGEQYGTFVNLGQGNSPGPRRAATVQVNTYRNGPNAPCGFQAIATTWKTT